MNSSSVLAHQIYDVIITKAMYFNLAFFVCVLKSSMFCFVFKPTNYKYKCITPPKHKHLPDDITHTHTQMCA